MFAITRDHIRDTSAPQGTNANAVGVVGPVRDPGIYEEIIEHPDRRWFRMRDDDNVLYYEGYYIPTPGSDELEPLDCFGTPNAGATTIEYQGKDGAWTPA